MHRGGGKPGNQGSRTRTHTLADVPRCPYFGARVAIYHVLKFVEALKNENQIQGREKRERQNVSFAVTGSQDRRIEN